MEIIGPWGYFIKLSVLEVSFRNTLYHAAMTRLDMAPFILYDMIYIYIPGPSTL